MSDTQNATTQLNLAPAGDATKSSTPAEPTAPVDTAATAEAPAPTVAAPPVTETPATSQKSKKRARRGPPADGAPEPRVIVLLTTSRLSDVDGSPLRRGQAVSVPERRLEGLIKHGKVRRGSDREIEAAQRRAPLGALA